MFFVGAVDVGRRCCSGMGVVVWCCNAGVAVDTVAQQVFRSVWGLYLVSQVGVSVDSTVGGTVGVSPASA